MTASEFPCLMNRLIHNWLDNYNNDIPNIIGVINESRIHTKIGELCKYGIDWWKKNFFIFFTFFLYFLNFLERKRWTKTSFLWKTINIKLIFRYKKKFFLSSLFTRIYKRFSEIKFNDLQIRTSIVFLLKTFFFSIYIFSV